jgi:aromatic-L-amino-acid decarboxylase
MATLTALAAARAALLDRRYVLCSEHTHSSIDKAARVLELELRRVPVDDAYRMRADLLDTTDACAVVATVGTTSTTSIDPVAEIAARKGDTWLHVDAAYAGSAWVCPELRLAGVERADSLVVNPHKWLLSGMGCSCLWTSRPEDFRSAFSLVPEYLRTPDDVISLSEVSIPLGRPFRALRLWAVLRCYGRSGLQAIICEHVRLAALFEGWVRDEPGWEVCAPRPFSVVCFRREGSDEENEGLLARVNAGGEIFISHTRLDGRYVLRLAIGNARTTEADVALAWEVLKRCAR